MKNKGIKIPKIPADSKIITNSSKVENAFFNHIAQELIDTYEKETGEIHMPCSPSWLNWLQRHGFGLPENILKVL